MQEEDTLNIYPNNVFPVISALTLITGVNTDITEGRRNQCFCSSTLHLYFLLFWLQWKTSFLEDCSSSSTMNILNRTRRDKHIFCCWADTQSGTKWQCVSLLTRVLPGCVWDWSHPTLWLLLREIPRADWCLVARRLGHLGRGRHCWGRILIWVTATDRKVQGNIRSHSHRFTASPAEK